jgi:dTDP-4-amino-4,6-dideoxygalactose transaminase
MLDGVDPNVTLRFYEVDYDLKVRSNEWVSEVTSGDLVIFIDYFGFPHDRRFAAQVKAKGAWVLEDACQALLSSHVGVISDFVLFSLRKWIGVPDGGILRVPQDFPLDGISLTMPASTWWLKALEAAILRREFDDGVPTREWFKFYRDAEDTAPTGPYAMSQLSQAIFEYSVDYSLATQRRRDNYRTLLGRLAHYALFPQIDSDVVPLGFPVRVAKRDAVRQGLFDCEIYPPVHWPLDGVVPPKYEDSHRLASQIMTLPCDQRYGPEDMQRMAEIFLEAATQH